MPRIFKGSESTLRLLLSKSGDYQSLTDIKIKLYTTNIENAIEIIDGITIEENIATITLAPRAFMGMEDGLINYIIDGASENDVFHTERQSNYMLKTLSYINEDGVATQTMTIDSNGEYRITPNDGLYVDISVNVEDVNGSFDEGFNVGYEQGKTDGVSEQKSKLEAISITENGVYSNEDGYNHIEVNVPDLNGSYDEGYADGEKASFGIGYNQGQKDIAENARVLEVTENGNYLSKFSDPINPTLVTGVYDDGTGFYSYTELSGAVYNTKIAGTIDSRLEFWYKGDGKKMSSSDIIIGSENMNDYKNSFIVQYKNFDATKLLIKVGNSTIEVSDFDETVWHHIIVSKAEGLWFDGEKKGDFSPTTNTVNGEFYINGIGSDGTLEKPSNGTFGMIKIDDVVIIPTADGFLNTNTGELLEILKDGGYTYTENLPIYGEGELYKTINVNVAPKINVKETGLKLGYSNFTEVPEWADFDGITDMRDMFRGCPNLQIIPQIDTSNVTTMQGMFFESTNIRTIPHMDTSKVTTMFEMFYGCSNLQTIPQIDTSNVTNMQNMFALCKSLVSVPALDARSLNMPSYYGFFGYTDLPSVTDLGGFLNLKCSLTSDNNLKRTPNLTYESCINILNSLYDFTGNGETPNSSQGQLKVHQNFLDTVGEDILIGTNKGWTITA